MSPTVHRFRVLLLPALLPGIGTTRLSSGPIRAGNVEATTGVEPVNSGFADRRVRPLRHVAAVVRRSGYGGCWLPLEDSNLGSRIQSPLSYH